MGSQPVEGVSSVEVDLRSGYMDTWTTGLGSEKWTRTTQERWKRERALVQVFRVMCGAGWNMTHG